VSPRPSALRGLVKAFRPSSRATTENPSALALVGGIGLRPSSCGTHMPVKGTTLKQVLWNGKAREQFSVQRVERERNSCSHLERAVTQVDDRLAEQIEDAEAPFWRHVRDALGEPRPFSPPPFRKRSRSFLELANANSVFPVQASADSRIPPRTVGRKLQFLRRRSER